MSSQPHPGGFEASDTIAGLIHDTRNMVMALDLYCDLLDEPGVLSSSFEHYAGELRLVSGASRRLMETLARLSLAERRTASERRADGQELAAANLLNFPDTVRELEFSVPSSMARVRAKMANLPAMGAETGVGGGTSPAGAAADTSTALRRAMPSYPGVRADRDGAAGAMARTSGLPDRQEATTFRSTGQAQNRKSVDLSMDRRIEDLAAELRANHNLLSALAGPRVAVKLSIAGGRIPIGMAPEDLTRVLVNLVRNAVEAMKGKGEILISLEEGPQFLALSFADSGPGIPRNVLDKIFSPGYSWHAAVELEDEGDADHSRAASDAGPTNESGVGRLTPPVPETDLGTHLSAWPIQHRGLGLSIVRAIVTAAGGSVWASNRAGNRGYSKSATAEPDEKNSTTKFTTSFGEPPGSDPGRGRAAPSQTGAQERDSGGAIIQIEFPLSASSESS
jgi:signal transduction histidine kinase